MKKKPFVFDLSDDQDVADLAGSLAFQIQFLAENVGDIDEGVMVQAIESVVSDIAQSLMEAKA
jgi:hypothetical protein